MLGAMTHDRRQALALNADLVALSARDVPDPGPQAGRQMFGDADYQTAAMQVLQDYGDGPIWLFAYGSLLWKPAFAPAESRVAQAEGWHRSFCIAMHRWRGSPEQPGLMLALRPGGSCTGLATRVPDGDRLAQMVTLLRRESAGPDGMKSLRIIDLDTAQGPLRAFAFTRTRSAAYRNWRRPGSPKCWRGPADTLGPALNIFTTPSWHWNAMASAMVTCGICKNWLQRKY